MLRPVRIAAALTAIAAIAAGCGGDDKPSARAQPTATPTRAATAGGPAERVIRGWVDALRRSDVERAASYFAVPVTIEQGRAFRLRSRSEIRTFNAGLPCGARLLSAEGKGAYVIGTFRLGERPGKRCDSPGGNVRVAFVVRGDKIAEWRQVPEPRVPPADAEVS